MDAIGISEVKNWARPGPAMMKEFVAGGTAGPGTPHQVEADVDRNPSTCGLACQAAAAAGRVERRVGQTSVDPIVCGQLLANSLPQREKTSSRCIIGKTV